MTRIGVLAALVATVLSHPVAPSFAGHESRHAFCSSSGPRDYATPLSTFSPINKVPGRPKKSGVGNLPFGPGTVEMYAYTEGPVIARPDEFGYAFSDVGFERKNPPKDRPKLDWLVTAQMMALDPTGAVSEQVDQGQIRIRTIDDAYQPSLNLKVPARVGFYRYDIQISEFDGTLLGSYSQYLRVVPHSVKVRLGINARRVRPGQTIATRPEELGTDWISYGEAFTVQRRIDGDWRPYPPMDQKFWNDWLGLAGPGEAGRCSFLSIPAYAPKGRYRVVKHIGVEEAGEHELGVTVTAPFSVSGSPTLRWLASG